MCLRCYELKYLKMRVYCFLGNENKNNISSKESSEFCKWINSVRTPRQRCEKIKGSRGKTLKNA